EARGILSPDTGSAAARNASGPVVISELTKVTRQAIARIRRMNRAFGGTQGGPKTWKTTRHPARAAGPGGPPLKDKLLRHGWNDRAARSEPSLLCRRHASLPMSSRNDGNCYVDYGGGEPGDGGNGWMADVETEGA